MLFPGRRHREVCILDATFSRYCLSGEKIGHMKRLLLFCLLTGLFVACKKERDTKVEIYLLDSFTRSVDASTNPAIIRYSNTSLAALPLVADGDIVGYSPSKTTFYLQKNIAPIIKNFGPDKAFAVTVDGQPVYIGEFRPAYLSSIVFGIASITPELVDGKELPINYIRLDNAPSLQHLDKRNDNKLLDAFRRSGRLR